MAEEINIDIRTGRAELPPVTTAKLTPEQQKAYDKAIALKQLQDKVHQYIINIQNSHLPDEVKRKLVADLSGVQNSTDPASINTVLAYAYDVQLMAAASETVEQLIYMLIAQEPGYAYSMPGRRYMAATLREAIHQSPELQSLIKQLDALPTPVREYAQNEQRQNWQQLSQMLKDPSYQAYKEQLELYRGFALANTPQGRNILASIQSGVAPDQITTDINHVVEAQIKSTSPFIENHLKHTPEPTQKYLLEHFHKADGALDAEAVQRAWAKTRAAERDEAYQAMIKSGNDITKLLPEHQRIIHMSQVMIAADAAAVAKGTIAIIERNAEIGRVLTDTSLSVDERKGILYEKLTEAGVRPNDQESFLREAREAVIALDDAKRNGVTYDAKNPQAFEKAFGKEYKENLYEVAGIKQSQVDVRRIDNAIEAANTVYAYNASMQFVVASRADDDIPAYIANDPIKLAAYQKEQDAWKASYARMAAANPSESLAAIDPKSLPGFPPGVSSDRETRPDGIPPEGGPTQVAAAKPPTPPAAGARLG